MALIFWASVAFIFYVYVGYPLLLWVFQALLGSAPAKQAVEPAVSVLVAAYNEGAVIADKIRNTLSLHYPPDKLELVIASDGSTDATAEITRTLAEKEGTGRVRLIHFEQNRGKMAVLNDAITQLRGEIVAFSDASSMLAPDSIRTLVQNFGDPSVGAAGGLYRVLKEDQSHIGSSEGFYWKYETFLKLQEAKLGACTGLHGSLYAIRRTLYPFPPARTINDDFTIPVRIVGRGYRVAYETGAVAYEEALEMEGFYRRVRITAGNVEQLRELKQLLWPPRPFPLLCLLSHKTARLPVPLFMLTALAANVALRGFPYNVMLIGQALFYGVALLGTMVRLRPKILQLPYYFCMINFALVAWLFYTLRRGASNSIHWGTPRPLPRQTRD